MTLAPRVSSAFKTVRRILVRTWYSWLEVDATRMGAALAYYSVLSLAPMLIVCITIASFVFGEAAVRGELAGQVDDLVGPKGGQAIMAMVEAGFEQRGKGIGASIFGFLTLLFGASSLVGELISSLNRIFDVKEEGTIRAILKQRSYALALVLGAGFLVIVSLLLSTTIALVTGYFEQYLPVPKSALIVGNWVISTLTITALFGLMFKVLPSRALTWRQVLPGALFTAILFTAGKSLIGLYLGRASFGSVYGAAGSVVIVLAWVFYTAQIFFFGAVFTRNYIIEGSPERYRAAGAS